MNLSGSFGPVIVTVMVQSHSWRTILSASGLVCLLSSFICLLLIKNEPKDVGLPNIEAAAKKSKGGTTISEELTRRLAPAVQLRVVGVGEQWLKTQPEPRFGHTQATSGGVGDVFWVYFTGKHLLARHQSAFPRMLF